MVTHNKPNKRQGWFLISSLIILFLSIALTTVVFLLIDNHGKIILSDMAEEFSKNDAEKINAALLSESETLAKGKTKTGEDLDLINTDELDKKLKEIGPKKDEIKINIASIKDRPLTDKSIFKLEEFKELIGYQDGDKKKKQDEILKTKIDKGFSREKIKGKPVVLNDELIKFIADENKKEKDFPKEFGKKWLKEIEDQFKVGRKKALGQMDIKEKESGLKGKEKAPSKISAFSDKKAEFEGGVNMDGLKNLLLEISPKNVNLFFAFNYFPNHKGVLKSRISTDNYKMIPKNDQSKIDKKREEMLQYFNAYEEFLMSLTAKPKQ